MIRSILILLVCSCIGLDANPSELERYRPQIHNEKRYEDLLEDPFNKRFLSIMLDPRSHDGPNSGFTMINRDEIVWCREQGVKAFPIILEILKREPNPNAGDHGEIWRSVDFKEHVLCFINNFTEGDTKPFVEEVRRQLPQWSERQIPNHDAHTGFILQALDLLAREGDESDIPLIESFLKDVNRNNKHNAQTSLTKLKERLAKESSDKKRSRNQAQSDRKSADGSIVTDVGKSETGEKKSRLQNVIAAFLIIGIMFLVVRLIKQKSHEVS